MSGIVGGINLRSSGLVNISSATDGQVFTGTGAGLPVGFEAAAGGGKVLQVVTSGEITGAFSSTSTTYVDVTSVTQAITPTLDTSKVLCIIDSNIGCVQGNYHVYGIILRESTEIGSGADASSRIGVGFYTAASYVGAQEQFTKIILDEPESASSVTYKCQVKAQSASYAVCVNRTGVDTDDAYIARLSSRITLIEIGA